MSVSETACGAGTAGTDQGPLHRGRSLDAARGAALQAAALELLSEIGYDRLTMDAVAARAHASKTTIYRRWHGKAELVVDALNGRKGPMIVPDTGSLRRDLGALVESSTGSDNVSDTQVMLGLITALASDAELREVFARQFVEPRKVMLRAIFERAMARGEVPDGRNIDLLISLFPALMIQHLVDTGELPGVDFARLVMNDVILPLATAPVASTVTSRTLA
jgi:AcrR family transcriptional regulator